MTQKSSTVFQAVILVSIIFQNTLMTDFTLALLFKQKKSFSFPKIFSRRLITTSKSRLNKYYVIAVFFWGILDFLLFYCHFSDITTIRFCNCFCNSGLWNFLIKRFTVRSPFESKHNTSFFLFLFIRKPSKFMP